MKKFNEGLLKIKKNGIYKKLETKYSQNQNNQIIPLEKSNN